MLLLVVFAIGVAAVPLARGRLTAVAEVRLAAKALLFGALGIQILIISVIPGGSPVLHKTLHFASYGLAGAFLVANRRIAGAWLVALGGGLNLTAIAANGGVMPAISDGQARAGEFVNAGVVPDPKLGFLGDIFAVPSSWPLANVFSVGDVLLVVGAVVAVHALAGSRLGPRAVHAQPST